uniref:Uncharacterized protein n=1 Tax=Ditylenchus dipsaci TaxID=166011 RepID=A0A915CZD7_9BILA
MTSTVTSAISQEVLTSCQNVEILSRSVVYKLILFIKGWANAIGIAAFVFHIFTQKEIYLLARCFGSYSFTNFYTMELWRLVSFVTDPCARLWWTPSLFYLRAAYASCLTGMNSSMIVLCIERIVCISQISNYEESSRPKLVAFLLTFLALFFCIVFVLLYLPGIDWSHGLPVSTVRNANNAANFQIMLYFFIIMEFLGVFFFFFIHNWEMTDIPCISSVSVKFQVEETIQITKLFLPLVTTKCLLLFFSVFAMIFINKMWPNTTVDEQMIIYESINIQYVQPLPTAFWLLYGSGQLKKFFCLKKNSVMEAEYNKGSDHDQDDHF